MYVDIKSIAWMVLLFFAFRLVWTIAEGALEDWRGRHARHDAAEPDMWERAGLEERESEVRARGRREGWL